MVERNILDPNHRTKYRYAVLFFFVELWSKCLGSDAVNLILLMRAIWQGLEVTRTNEEDVCITTQQSR